MLNSFGLPRRSQLFRGAAILALCTGYAVLASGETTLAPLLLVVAYVLLVPFALLVS